MDHGATRSSPATGRKARFPTEVLSLQPGDAVFFDALLMHASPGNFSPRRRMAFASCFTRADNVQFRNPYLPCEDVDEVPYSELLERGLVTQAEGASSAVMLDANEGRERAAKRDGE